MDSHRSQDAAINLALLDLKMDTEDISSFMEVSVPQENVLEISLSLTLPQRFGLLLLKQDLFHNSQVGTTLA